jgi:hypothetical protein
MPRSQNPKILRVDQAAEAAKATKVTLAAAAVVNMG